MGSNQGVIFNDSDFIIQYFVYGKFQQMINKQKTTDINPELSVDLTGVVEISGFQHRVKDQRNFKYQNSMVEVQVGRICTMGLNELKMDEHKVTIKAIIGDYEKVLASNVVIKEIKDIRIKIRNDLSIKNLQDQEFKKLMKLVGQITNGITLSPEQQKQRAQRRQKCLQNLKQKDKAYQQNK